jgi:hypothetical protein
MPRRSSPKRAAGTQASHDQGGPLIRHAVKGLARGVGRGVGVASARGRDTAKRRQLCLGAVGVMAIA